MPSDTLVSIVDDGPAFHDSISAADTISTNRFAFCSTRACRTSAIRRFKRDCSVCRSSSSPAMPTWRFHTAPFAKGRRFSLPDPRRVRTREAI